MDDRRKEEKVQLIEEISKLEARLAFLSQQAVSDVGKTVLSVEDLSESHHTMEDVVSSEGDILNDRFIVVQYEQQSVRTVFDSVLYYGANVEFVMSESDDCVTIREDADDDNKTAPGITPHVLQVTMAPGVVAEYNTVMFSEYNAREDVALIVARFVDEDELHPYKLLERIRHDLTMVGMFSKLPDTDTVVVRFWGHLRWHR
ncbi:hypothetical protein Poli38472_012334 [Pythium oligandrum]|uniref:Uncharacterized protein n=1 Tax=Pythium oligandrum TaxID=41045 RepID=A0A8K1CQN9_PYTOL|nr:hypothetical protein Poli38472_012334 [Pythium oligandrum]|eukprot:TMW67218.1 hypothetical protein Poli38472_012334 [Pythium oligandrum]